MKKALFALLLMLPLGGCLTLGDVTTGVTLATKSVANPITRDDLAKVELAGDTIIQAALVYRRACVANAADKQCRANVAAVQAYTRLIPPYIAQLRSFVRNNDQVNAVVAYNQLASLYSNAKASAAALGINLGS